MRFTQFRFPHGTPKDAEIAMPAPVEALAKELSDAGWSFECELFPDTQLFHADCCDEEDPIADVDCLNGPDVPETVAKLVDAAHAEWVRRGKPKASGNRLQSIERKKEAFARSMFS